jgi:CHASE2 domain-containing sensor protein
VDAKRDHPKKASKSFHTESFLHRFLFGLVVIAAVIAVKTQLEQTRSGRWIELATYDFLQFRMAISEPSRDLDVAVLDISGENGLPVPGTDRPGIQTSTGNVEDLVRALAECNPAPLGIGIDIDYSPDKGDRELNAGIRRLLDFCLETSRGGIPVFVGIKRSLDQKPDRWLWEPQYEPLAANMLIPRDEENGVRHMWLWFELEEIGTPSPSLSAALAGVYPKIESERVGGAPLNLSWAIELFRTQKYNEKGVRIIAKEFLVDYAPVDQIRRTALNTARPDMIKKNEDLFAGKLVLIGDSRFPSQNDTFIIPGRRDQVPGVVVHACATRTLKSSPVYELTTSGQLAIDAVFSGAVLGLSLGANWFARKKVGREIDFERVHGIFTWVIVLGGLTAGVIFVHVTRVIWDDFLFVTAALLVHSRFEQLLHRSIEWVKGGSRRFLDSLFNPR